MSTFHKKYRSRTVQPVLWHVFVWVMTLCAGRLEAQLSTEDMNTLLIRLKNGGDPHELSIAISGIESGLREGPESNKLPGVLQALDMAASIYRTRDVSVSTDGIVGRWPDFDATKFGGKPIFSGADPQSIEDPKIRAAYEKALADHEKTLDKVSAELRKLEEGDYCATAALRILQSSKKPAALKETVAKHLSTSQDASWIKERLSKVMLVAQVSQDQSVPPHTPSESGQHANAKVAISKPDDQLFAPRPTDQTSVSGQAPSPSSSETLHAPKVWVVAFISVVAALGFFWFFRKKAT
jgi:hypothetical protein